MRSILLTAVLAFAAPTISDACQIYVTPPNSANTWSGACTAVASDGIVAIKYPQVTELLSNLSETVITGDFSGVRLTGLTVFGVNIQDDLLLLSTGLVFSNDQLPRPLDPTLAASLIEARLPQLIAKDGSFLRMGDWRFPRPGSAFSCVTTQAKGNNPSTYDCQAKLEIAVTDKPDAGQLKIKHYILGASGPLTPKHFEPLGRVYDNAASGLGMQSDPNAQICDHQVVVTPKKAQLKIDYCVSNYGAKKGFSNGVLKIATVNKQKSTAIVALDFYGFSSEMIKEITSHYIETIGLN